jgi:uncharacterized protein (TIGR00255 family)
MKSMTGYAKVEGLIDDRLWVIEIKTVNHRFCDINLKLSKPLTSLESVIKKYLGKKINRGRVDAIIQVENGGSTNFRVDLNLSLAQEYYNSLIQLKRKLNLTEDVSLLHILSLKDVIYIEKIEEDFQKWDELQSLLESALASLDAMREAEGEALKQDLVRRVKNISKIVSEIESYAPQVVQFQREKLLKRFHELHFPFEINESRLLTEVFLLAERTDITEELVRIKSHLRQCEGLFEVSTPIGRKLDFIFQEINRELNTISSKTNDVRISQLVIEAKSDLEKMREQVQNVE